MTTANNIELTMDQRRALANHKGRIVLGDRVASIGYAHATVTRPDGSAVVVERPSGSTVFSFAKLLVEA